MAVKVYQGVSPMEGGSCNGCNKWEPDPPMKPKDLTVVSIGTNVRQVSRLCKKCTFQLLDALKAHLKGRHRPK